MTKSVFSYFLEGLASQTSTPWIYFVLNFIIFLSTAAFFLFVKHILQLLILFNSRKILLISQSQLRIERLSLYTILLLFSALTSINTSDPVSAAAHIYSHAITLFQPYFWDEVLRSWAFLFSSFWYQKIFCFQTKDLVAKSHCWIQRVFQFDFIYVLQNHSSHLRVPYIVR